MQFLLANKQSLHAMSRLFEFTKNMKTLTIFVVLEIGEYLGFEL